MGAVVRLPPKRESDVIPTVYIKLSEPCHRPSTIIERRSRPQSSVAHLRLARETRRTLAKGRYDLPRGFNLPRLVPYFL